MSHSSYTASERRGIIAIALIALLLIGGGVTLSLCGRKAEIVKEIPVVVEHPELVDTVTDDSKAENASKKKSSKKKKSSQSSSKNKKTYRRRSPIDETV